MTLSLTASLTWIYSELLLKVIPILAFGRVILQEEIIACECCMQEIEHEEYMAQIQMEIMNVQIQN